MLAAAASQTCLNSILSPAVLIHPTFSPLILVLEVNFARRMYTLVCAFVYLKLVLKRFTFLLKIAKLDL